MSDYGILLFCRAIQAQAEIEAMKAMNASRADKGYAQAYPEEAFFAVRAQLDEQIQRAMNSPGFGT